MIVAQTMAETPEPKPPRLFRTLTTAELMTMVDEGIEIQRLDQSIFGDDAAPPSPNPALYWYWPCPMRCGEAPSV